MVGGAERGDATGQGGEARTREAARPRGKRNTRRASVFLSVSQARMRFARGGKDRGRRAGTHAGTSRTRRSSGASRRWSCLCRRRGTRAGRSARVRRSGGRGGSRRGTRDAAGSAIAQILKKTRQACSFSAPTMGRRGGSRTGTAVTDEDQLERGRLSHLSARGSGERGRSGSAPRGASRRPGERRRAAPEKLDENGARTRDARLGTRRGRRGRGRALAR